VKWLTPVKPEKTPVPRVRCFSALSSGLTPLTPPPPTTSSSAHSVVQRPRLPIKGLKLWRFDNTLSKIWAYFHCACMRINGASGQKMWPRHSLRWLTSISYKTDVFPLSSDVHGIWCFCANTSHDLVTLTFDLLTMSVSYTALLMTDPHTNFDYRTTIGYWVTITEYLITFPLSETITAHARVTWPITGGKNSPHFEISDPICVFTLSLSGN